MLTIFKNKQNSFNDKSLTTNYITEKNIKIQSNSERDEYKNLIFYPSSSKEWFSSIYSYNKSYIKSLISYDAVLNKLLRSYCNMLQDKIKILFKRRRDNKIRYSANKIYASRAELKHTNTKLFITLYIYNKQKSSIEWYIRKIITLIRFYKIRIEGKTIFLPNHKNRLLHLLKKNFFIFKKWNIAFFKPINNLVRYSLVNLRKRYLIPYNIPPYTIRLLKKFFRLEKILFNSTRLINFNKYKFNSLNLYVRNLGLISLIEKLYNKKVVINLVEKKSIHLNSDVFSSAVALKLRDRKNKAVRILRKAILQMVRIPDLHTLITFDDNIEEMNKNNIINTIKQQIVSGVRFEASGRLTRRLTAMRAVFKYRYAGSLKNIRSSFDNKSSTILRGYVKSNSQYTLINSKTRNGTFGLKGWVSSHWFIGFATKDCQVKVIYILIKISVVIIGIAIITYLLGLNFFACSMLVLFISIILSVLLITKENYNHLPYALNLLLLTIVMGVSTLTDLAMTVEFHVNYPHLSEIDVVLLCIGTARIIFGILFTKNEISYFSRIKKIIYEFLPYLKKNPLYYLAVGIAIYLLFIIFINLSCLCLGVTPCINDFFSYYIYIFTRVILVNSTISLVLLAVTKSSKEQYNIVGMSIWLPVALIPSTLLYYFYILPELINIKLALVDIIHITLTKLEQVSCKFKLAILYVVDDLEIILSHLKEGWFYLEPLFFLGIRNLGELLIRMHNRPAELGKFFVKWGNWGLGTKVESITNKPHPSMWDKVNFLDPHLLSIKNSLKERSFDFLRPWINLSSRPIPIRITPGHFTTSLPFSARGSNTMASSLAYQTISSRIFLENFSLEFFKGSFHTFMKNSENVRGFFSAMENLGVVKFILSGNSTVELNRIGLNTVKVICIDNSRAGFLEFDIKDLVIPDFIPSCNISNGLDSNMCVKQIGFCAKNSSFDIQAWSEGLTAKSSRDETLANTDPSKIGYNCNQQVYMQSDTSHDNQIYSGESSRGDLVQNSGTKRSRAESPIGDIGDKSIQAKALDIGDPAVSLKFDLNKLSPTEDNSIEWKEYLGVICIEARVVFIQTWGSDKVEKATMDNIYLDYDDDNEQNTHLSTLCDAIIRATGDTNMNWKNFFLLSEDFIYSLDTQSQDDVYTDTDDKEDSESENIIDTTERYNYNNSNEQLNNDEIQSLIDDLRNRQSNIKSGRKSLLRNLRISVNRSSKNIMEGTEDKKQHLLLSRLYRTNKECFTKRSGYPDVGFTKIADLITKLENLKHRL